MPTRVTDPTVAAFVAATNAADAAGIEALLAGAVVTDNGVVFDDDAAIARWVAEDVVGSGIRLHPVECTGGVVPVLVADADGRFPGGVSGPIRFELRFTTVAGRVARLDIRPLR